MLDFDATDNPLQDQQEARFFYGYYDSYCYFPLYVFCGQQRLCAYLRPRNIDGAEYAAAILKLLVRRLHQQAITEFLALSMKDEYEPSGLKQGELGEFVYAAQS